MGLGSFSNLGSPLGFRQGIYKGLGLRVYGFRV